MRAYGPAADRLGKRHCLVLLGEKECTGERESSRAQGEEKGDGQRETEGNRGRMAPQFAWDLTGLENWQGWEKPGRSVVGRDRVDVSATQRQPLQWAAPLACSLPTAAR